MFGLKLQKAVSFLLLLGLFCTSLSAQNFSKLYARLNPSVVTILTGETVFTDGDATAGGGLGTGVIVDKNGLIMTAAHVVGSAEQIMVKINDDLVIEAEVISSVTAADVALIKLKQVPRNLSVATLGDSDAVQIGDQIMVIGAPFGLEHSLSIGYISGKQNRGMIMSGQEVEFLQTDAAINHGNSGGPIFNTEGDVIGIVSSILSQSGGFDGIGFAASISPAKKILLESSPFWTGFEGVFMEERLAKIFNVPAKGGVLVQRVVTGSIADKAGLRGGWLKASLLGSELWVGGDIILSIEEKACDTPHNFDNIKTQMEKHPEGQIFHMTVLRGGEKIKLTMKYE
jgi:S1-C subfamily serine protease